MRNLGKSHGINNHVEPSLTDKVYIILSENCDCLSREINKQSSGGCTHGDSQPESHTPESQYSGRNRKTVSSCTLGTLAAPWQEHWDMAQLEARRSNRTQI